MKNRLNPEFISYLIRQGTSIHNSLNQSGSGFVSFVIRRQNAQGIDASEVESFLLHYQFARKLFEGFVCKLLPEPEILKIEEPEKDPFFLYFEDFASRQRYERGKNDFERVYRQLFGRSFDFDCRNHQSPMQSDVDLGNRDSVSDEALWKAGGGVSNRFANTSSLKKSLSACALILERSIGFLSMYRCSGRR